MYFQFTLEHDEAVGVGLTHAWLRSDPRLRVGSSLSLKHDPHTVRRVVAIHGPVQAEPPDQRWRVGGLS